MKNLKVKGAAVTGALFTAFGLVALAPGSVYAAESGGTCPSGMARSSYTNNISECSIAEEHDDTEENGGGLWGTINTIINVVLGMLGIVAVVMIILGGFRFLTSAGDASKVKSGKDTILYGIVGLIIALLAFAIVNFVISGIFSSGSSGGSGGGSSNGSSTSSASSRSGRETVETD